MVAPRFELSREASLSVQDETSIIVEIRDRYYRLSGIALDVLLSIKSRPKTLEELDIGQYERSMLSEVLESLVIKNVLVDLEGVAVSPDSDKTSPNSKARAAYMVLQLPILSANWVQLLARPFSHLMIPKVLYASMPVLVIVQLAFLFKYGDQAVNAIHRVHYGGIALILAVNYALLFLHEIGHAAGSIRAGTPPGRMGVGLYLIYPVMFIDVSRSWLVPPQKRLWIDAGGLYFTGVSAVCAILFYVYWHSPITGVIAYLLCITTVVNLNPFLRMDGYWICSDLLDAPDLMAATASTTRWLLKRPFRKDGAFPDLGLKNLPSRCVYAVYYVGFASFSAYFLFSLLAYVVPHSIIAVMSKIRTAMAIFNHNGFTIEFLGCVAMALLCSLPILLLILPFGAYVYQRSRTGLETRESI